MTNSTGCIKKSFYIKTFGCQMNEADSERLRAILIQDGYNESCVPEKADVIILNTCSVRQKAEDKVYQYLNQFKAYKKKNPDCVIAVGGCLGQEKKDKLLDDFSFLDLVFGSESFLKVPVLLKTVVSEKKRLVETNWDIENEILTAKISWVGNNQVTTSIPITRGCSNFCSYCVVPHTRGVERSRPFFSIIEEINEVVEKGIKEITLLGQNVNSYRYDEKDFCDLLENLNDISGLQRIRFLTSHPRDLNNRFIETIKKCGKVCENFHFPLQSASNRILELMNRGYTVEEYYQKIEAIRNAMPASSITTDIIVGFPSETEEDFLETLNYVRKIEFDSAFMFIYSSRPNTKAFELHDSVDTPEKKRRLNRLIEIQENISRKKNGKLLGKKLEVLVDGVCRKEKTKLFGKSRTNKSVVFAGDCDLIGKEVIVKITNTGPHTLGGEVEWKN